MKETNIVVLPHNAWTLTKHVAGSINKVAAKTDSLVYGNTTNIVVTEQPFSKKHPTIAGIGEVFAGIVVVILIIFILIGWIRGDIKTRDILTFP